MPNPNLPESITAGSSGHLSHHEAMHKAYNAPFPQIQQEKTADFTFALAESNDMVTVNSASAVVATIPTDAAVAIPVGVVIGVFRKGPGSVTITPDTGVDLESSPNTAGSRSISGQYGVVAVWKRFSNKWVVFGDLA